MNRVRLQLLQKVMFTISCAVLILLWSANVVSAAKYGGKVVDENAKPLERARVELWTQSGVLIESDESDDNGTFNIVVDDLNVANIGPVELMFRKTQRHVVFVDQLDGSSEHDVTVVMFPIKGPKKYERVIDQLWIYERLYYVIAGSSNPRNRASRQELRNMFLGNIKEIPDPDGNRVRDREFREQLDGTQLDLIRRKRQDVLSLYGERRR